MNERYTFLLSVVGSALFAFGGMARMVMVVRLKGWAGYLSSQRNLMQDYRQLVKDNSAPRWPIPVSILCIPLGIVVVFGSILFAK